jgi:hypothetical protein
VLGLDGVVSCGIELTKATADPEGSTVEDLCSQNEANRIGTSPQQLQLVRQCAAAALNLAASEQAELSCESAGVGDADEIAFDDIEERFAQCCGFGIPGDLDFEAGVCNSDSTPSDINASGCIGYLDAFNNAAFNEGDFEDTIADLAGGDWNSTEPEQCTMAGKNELVNDQDENNGRDYGPRK